MKHIKNAPPLPTTPGKSSQISDLRSQTSGLWSQIYQISNRRSHVSDLRSQISALRSQLSDLRSQMPEFEQKLSTGQFSSQLDNAALDSPRNIGRILRACLRGQNDSSLVVYNFHNYG